MNLPGFIKNKYTVSALILLGLLGTDIVLHKGMSRVILPEPFTDKVKPSMVKPLSLALNVGEKSWTRGVNQPEWLDKVPEKRGGIEFDAYFDRASGKFLVYHDSGRMSTLRADSLLTEKNKRAAGGAVWMDFKNLDSGNLAPALEEALKLREGFSLDGKFIIESSRPALLKAFSDRGFYTSYYVPFFNPYVISEDSLVNMLGSIRQDLEQHPVCSLSGYYFQYPVLRKFFPLYPVLTWADESSLSLVGYYFKKTLQHDEMVKVILYPLED